MGKKSDIGGVQNARALAMAVSAVIRSTSPGSRFLPASHRSIGSTLKASLFAASSGAVLASALAVAPFTRALAQEAEIDEIRVTGSRIPRRDFVANSPITTIDQTTFEDTSTIGIETVLNQFPQFVPAVTQFTTTDVQNTAMNTVAASTVSLRGLGPNRNLVLIDGRRGQPVNSTMVVDTNSIPSTAIQRVEVISGGASAVYGADAVGGVVNFILKDNFEGATLDARYGATQHGGSTQLNLSGLIGGNFASGRGNAMFGFEFADRQKQRIFERDWRVDDLANPNIGSNVPHLTETYFTAPLGVANAPSQAAINAVFPMLPAGSIGRNSRFYINRSPDGQGTVWTGWNAATAPGAVKYEGPFEDPRGTGLPFRKRQPDGRIAENTLYQFTSTPLDRYSTFARGRFDVAENLRLVAHGMFTRTRSATNLGTPSSTVEAQAVNIPHGNEVYLPSLASDGTTLPAYQTGGRFGLNCPQAGGCTNSQAFPLPPEIEFLMASRPDPNGDVRLHRATDFVREALSRARDSRNNTSTFQLMLGLEGDLPSGNHFWDVNVSHGQTETVVNLGGNARLEAYRSLVRSPNFGVSFSQQGNPEGAGFASGFATCETGLPVVRDFRPSDDCIRMITADLHNTTQVDQTILEANLVGTLAEMPAGALQYALGSTYREAEYSYQTDSLTVNEAFLEAAVGLFPTQNSRGRFEVRELYGELLIPIVQGGVRGVEHFNLELGGRVSDFSTVGTVETFKGLLDWAITPRYRLRGGFNRAHRAPNLGELFMERTQTFGGTGSVLGDQCSQNSQNGPFSANPQSNIFGPEGAQRTLQLCRQMMGSTGAAEFYDNRTITDQPEVGGTGIPNTTGNRDLTEEQANTWTMGFVMNFLEGFTLTLDWFEIEIKDMIARENADAVFERCLSPAFNPAANPDHPACMMIARDPSNGNVVSTDLSFTNQGRAKATGIDVQLNWTRQFGWGGLNLNAFGSYNLGAETQFSADQDTIDWAGTLGCALQMECMGYTYRVFTTLSYFNGPYAVSLRTQYWPSIKAGAAAINPNTTAIGVTTSYALFALSGSYRFGDRYTFRAGIENLLDRDPPRSGGNPNATPFPVVGNRAPGSTYDPLGRRGFVSISMDF
jgi:iron complex outermembrane recepter protein